MLADLLDTTNCTQMKINSITIVGGGTSGWLSAAYLQKQNPNVKITLIDKERGTPVSVGEATILSFVPFMESCGFEMADWFNKIDATYKSGILFTDWTETSDVWHPFYNNPQLSECTLQDAWLNSSKKDFTIFGLPLWKYSVKNLIDEEHIGAYAIHMDCSKLVEYIKTKIGIEYIQSDVSNFDGDTLTLKNGNQITSDLYIDCSGFKSILKVPEKVDLTNRLFCDTAIAGHVQYVNKEVERRPFVISDMVDHGWVWHIPVQSRIGTGMVFNRSITPVDEAKEYFNNYWNGRIGELKILDWVPYYSKNIWQDNVVSIGLSAGFIEPLESTGVALITEGLQRLQDRISMRFYTQRDIIQYNLDMSSVFEDAIDFVSMHYSRPWKNTKFWNWVKDTYVETDRISLIRQVLTKELLYSSNFSNTGIFSGQNWTTWMIQLGYDVNTVVKLSKDVADDMVDQFSV